MGTALLDHGCGPPESTPVVLHGGTADSLPTAPRKPGVGYYRGSRALKVQSAVFAYQSQEGLQGSEAGYALEDRTPVPSAGERQADFHAFVQEELDRERKELQQEDELSHWDEQVRKRITAKQAAAAVQVAVYPPDYPEQGAVQKAVAIGLLADACTYFLPDSDSDTGVSSFRTRQFERHSRTPTFLLFWAWITGVKVKVLVDSGASTNIIAESTVQQLKGIKPVRHEQAMRVRVADGTTYDANSCVRPKLQAETSKGSYSQQVELRVMPIDLKVDIILGGPWLADLSPVTLDYKNWGSVRFAKGREEVVITGCSPGSPDPGRPKDTAMALVQGVILSQRRARRDLRALRAKEEQAFVVYLAPDGLFGASACDKGGEDSDEDSPNNVVAGLASEPSSGSEDVNEKPPAPSAAAREGASESEGPGVLVLDYSSDSSDANGVCHLGRVGAVVEELRPKGFTSTADEAGDHPDPLSVFANKREANGAFALLPAAVRRQAIEDHAAGKPPTWHAQAAAALQQGRELVTERRPGARRIDSSAAQVARMYFDQVWRLHGVPDRALLEFERIEAKRVEREKLRVRKARDESVGAVWTTLSEELRVDGAMPWVPEERFDDEVGTFARVSVDVAVPLVNGAAALEKEPIGQTKILVLFSGTGSVEKQFTKQFPDSKVVAVDIQPQMAPYSF
ncbi:hypothetical protein CYMTET_6379 [Cymbomonas tetramitiformis]|uniref:Uncharacterized protein n=1 Tax=Cymbomonas tetramitiformis TaxID=36881 RepID=A0AAE0GXI2_9CHLO|nr:hypothetical protein CYMTET_6379 [Cymbomonas tetramitiformis]